jgi:glycosyltransferase involved in cell wall biosynthesis
MRVGMIGPDLEAKGGIATLARTFLQSEAVRAHELRYFPTVGSGPIAQRVGQMALGQARAARAIFQGYRPELVHIHVADGLSFYRKLVYMREALALGVPVVLHNNFAHLERLYNKSLAHAALVRHTYTRAALVLAVSTDMAAQLKEWTNGQAKVEVLYNPVDTKELGRHTPRAFGQGPRVLFMGAIGPRKGVFDLVTAWAEVVKAVPGATLRIGGDGELPKLRERVAELGLGDSVELLGWVKGEDRLKVWAEADLYCLPSYAEGLPVSVLEAMASGLAVVSTAVNGTPDAVVEGETGLLIAPGDVGALRDRLVRLLQGHEERTRMGAAGRARVEEVFDGEVLGARLVELWERALRRR